MKVKRAYFVNHFLFKLEQIWRQDLPAEDDEAKMLCMMHKMSNDMFMDEERSISNET